MVLGGIRDAVDSAIDRVTGGDDDSSSSSSSGSSGSRSDYGSGYSNTRDPSSSGSDSSGSSGSSSSSSSSSGSSSSRSDYGSGYSNTRDPSSSGGDSGGSSSSSSSSPSSSESSSSRSDYGSGYSNTRDSSSRSPSSSGSSRSSGGSSNNVRSQDRTPTRDPPDIESRDSVDLSDGQSSTEVRRQTGSSEPERFGNAEDIRDQESVDLSSTADPRGRDPVGTDIQQPTGPGLSGIEDQNTNYTPVPVEQLQQQAQEAGLESDEYAVRRNESQYYLEVDRERAQQRQRAELEAQAAAEANASLPINVSESDVIVEQQDGQYVPSLTESAQVDAYRAQLVDETGAEPDQISISVEGEQLTAEIQGTPKSEYSPGVRGFVERAADGYSETVDQVLETTNLDEEGQREINGDPAPELQAARQAGVVQSGPLPPAFFDTTLRGVAEFGNVPGYVDLAYEFGDFVQSVEGTIDSREDAVEAFETTTTIGQNVAENAVENPYETAGTITGVAVGGFAGARGIRAVRSRAPNGISLRADDFVSDTRAQSGNQIVLERSAADEAADSVPADDLRAVRAQEESIPIAETPTEDLRAAVDDVEMPAAQQPGSQLSRAQERALSADEAAQIQIARAERQINRVDDLLGTNRQSSPQQTRQRQQTQQTQQRTQQRQRSQQEPTVSEIEEAAREIEAQVAASQQETIGALETAVGTAAAASTQRDFQRGVGLSVGQQLGQQVGQQLGVGLQIEPIADVQATQSVETGTQTQMQTQTAVGAQITGVESTQPTTTAPSVSLEPGGQRPRPPEFELEFPADPGTDVGVGFGEADVEFQNPIADASAVLGLTGPVAPAPDPTAGGGLQGPDPRGDL